MDLTLEAKLQKAWENYNGITAPENKDTDTFYAYGRLVADGSFFSDFPGTFTASSFKEWLDNSGPDASLTIRFNSHGGSLTDGVAMASLLKNKINGGAKVTAIVDGMCASAVTFPFLECSTRLMNDMSRVMVHNPSGIMEGGASDFRAFADVLEGYQKDMAKKYASVSNLSEDQALDAMKAETFYNPDEAVENGIATGLVESKKDDKPENEAEPTLSNQAAATLMASLSTYFQEA